MAEASGIASGIARALAKGLCDGSASPAPPVSTAGQPIGLLLVLTKAS